MALSHAIVPALLTVGLAIGSYEAVQEVSATHIQAEQLEGCKQPSARIGATAIDFCKQQPVSSIDAQVATLKDKADTIGFIGGLSGIGALASGVLTLAVVAKETDALDFLYD